MTGRLITLEGIDGSGKSTLSKRLVEALAAEGVPAVWSVEPSRSWLGEAVRRGLKEGIPSLSEAFLFMADHVAHQAWVARENAAGRTVVCDRWADSCFAYQGAALREELASRGLDSLRWLEDVQRPFNREPDLTLLLDLPVSVSMARIGERGGELEKFERADFLEAVRANYLDLASRRKHYRIVRADRDAESVYREALGLVRAALALSGERR